MLCLHGSGCVYGLDPMGAHAKVDRLCHKELGTPLAISMLFCNPHHHQS